MLAKSEGALSTGHCGGHGRIPLSNSNHSELMLPRLLPGSILISPINSNNEKKITLIFNHLIETLFPSVFVY